MLLFQNVFATQGYNNVNDNKYIFFLCTQPFWMTLFIQYLFVRAVWFGSH